MRLSLLLAATGALAACSSTPDGPVSETGSLQSGDATLTSGEYADRFTVRLNQGQWLRATLDSDAFDTYLVVRFPNGQQSDLDDSTPGDTTSVTMVIQAQESGQFEIIATTYRPGTGGAYRLTYEVLDAEPPAAPATSAATTAPETDTAARTLSGSGRARTRSRRRPATTSSTPDPGAGCLDSLSAGQPRGGRTSRRTESADAPGASTGRRVGTVRPHVPFPPFLTERAGRAF